jgi:hypothetical protein
VFSTLLRSLPLPFNLRWLLVITAATVLDRHITISLELIEVAIGSVG